MRIRNPYTDDPRFDAARMKWGEPSITGQADDGQWWYVCLMCDATWIGPTADHCRWCEDRYSTHQASRIAELLYPPWMTNEGPRFDELSSIDQKIWRQTRDRDIGITGPGEWSDALYDAMRDGVISQSQATSALGRFRTWQMKSTQSSGSMPDIKPIES